MSDLSDRLKQSRINAGFGSVREASESLGIKYPTYAGHENGAREFDREDAAHYARRFKVDAGWLLTGKGASPARRIRLAGRIGAGAEINITNVDETGETVASPPDARPETIAVKVFGDSMFPAYDDGELLYYSENIHPADLVNRKCVVKLADGRIFVKILRPGTNGLWNLESINPIYPTMTDVVVDWVAKIDWTKPQG